MYSLRRTSTRQSCITLIKHTFSCCFYRGSCCWYCYCCCRQDTTKWWVTCFSSFTGTRELTSFPVIWRTTHFGAVWTQISCLATWIFQNQNVLAVSSWKYWFLSLFKNEFNILHTIYFVVIMHIDFKILYQWFLFSETTF